MMAAMIKSPQSFHPPPGMGRLLVKRYDFDGLKYDAKNGGTESGKPVDWSKHLTWTIYYAPSNPSESNPISPATSIAIGCSCSASQTCPTARTTR
jgi:hypothetical protein